MSLTRRDILLGAGIIAASAVDAVSSESAIAAKKQTTHADEPTGDGRRETETKSYGGARAFNGIYHGDYLNPVLSGRRLRESPQCTGRKGIRCDFSFFRFEVR